MSRLYGTMRGDSKAEVTRRVHNRMETYCASWSGAIRCCAYRTDEDEDYVRVSMTTWQGNGEYLLLYAGPIGRFDVECLGRTLMERVENREHDLDEQGGGAE